MITKDITVLDLFAGMGGFSKGLQDAGFNIVNHFFSEIEPNAIANYKHNFKNAIYAGSVNLISGASLPKVDIITFGSPCQDFSIAGQRSGLDGERSSLIHEAIRIIHETQPTFFIWENVKGAFSSNNSEDFWAIIQAFANLGNYNIEWQLLNTLWVLPQNRERIYLVGHIATTERSFAPIFPFTKNDRLFRISQAANGKQSQAKHSTTISTKARAESTYIEVPRKAGTITAGAKSGGLHSDMTVIKSEHFSNHQQDRIYDITGAMGCLSKNRGDDKAKIRVVNDSLRRLTEIECERLQGFPDNWTQYGIFIKSKKVTRYLNKQFLTPNIQGLLMIKTHNTFATETREIAQTNRYKLIGNAVTKTFPEIIAKRLIENYKICTNPNPPCSPNLKYDNLICDTCDWSDCN
jgi:DNA (cytosine-5)-methyltransferase 1